MSRIVDSLNVHLGVSACMSDETTVLLLAEQFQQELPQSDHRGKLASYMTCSNVATPFYNHHMKKSGYAFNYQLLPSNNYHI